MISTVTMITRQAGSEEIIEGAARHANFLAGIHHSHASGLVLDDLHGGVHASSCIS